VALNDSPNQAEGREQISFTLSANEAIVLSHWLSRTTENRAPADFEDQAEHRVLWNLDAMLESELVAPMREDYVRLLKAARDAVRDPERA
jgi:hypothetical protein